MFLRVWKENLASVTIPTWKFQNRKQKKKRATNWEDKRKLSGEEKTEAEWNAKEKARPITIET